MQLIWMIAIWQAIGLLTKVSKKRFAFSNVGKTLAPLEQQDFCFYLILWKTLPNILVCENKIEVQSLAFFNENQKYQRL